MVNVGQMLKGVVGMFGATAEMGAKMREEADNFNALTESIRDEERSAVDANQRGAVLAGLARMRGSKLASQQQVAFAAGGVDSSVGTAADVIAETALMTELDADTISNNAAREAWGHKKTVDNLKVKRTQSEARSRAAQEKGVLDMVGSLGDFAAGGIGTG